MAKPGRRVLFVDDEVVLGRVFVRQARMWGYEADAATSGQLALDMVGNNEYDVIICDFLLGTENGLELLERLAQIQSSAVLMLISAALPEDIAERIPGRRIHLIEKPWIGPDLRLRLAQALGGD